MEISAKQLRTRAGEALDWVDRGETVIVTYRGKPRAKLVSIDDGMAKKPCQIPAFGMWRDRDDMGAFDAYLRACRQPRHADCPGPADLSCSWTDVAPRGPRPVLG